MLLSSISMMMMIFANNIARGSESEDFLVLIYRHLFFISMSPGKFIVIIYDWRLRLESISFFIDAILLKYFFLINR